MNGGRKNMTLLQKIKRFFKRKKLSEYLMDYMEMSIEELERRSKR
jgi:hypothetical protein